MTHRLLGRLRPHNTEGIFWSGSGFSQISRSVQNKSKRKDAKSMANDEVVTSSSSDDLGKKRSGKKRKLLGKYVSSKVPRKRTKTTQRSSLHAARKIGEQVTNASNRGGRIDQSIEEGGASSSASSSTSSAKRRPLSPFPGDGNEKQREDPLRTRSDTSTSVGAVTSAATRPAQHTVTDHIEVSAIAKGSAGEEEERKNGSCDAKDASVDAAATTTTTIDADDNAEEKFKNEDALAFVAFLVNKYPHIRFRNVETKTGVAVIQWAIRGKRGKPRWRGLCGKHRKMSEGDELCKRIDIICDCCSALLHHHLQLPTILKCPKKRPLVTQGPFFELQESNVYPSGTASPVLWPHVYSMSQIRRPFFYQHPYQTMRNVTVMPPTTIRQKANYGMWNYHHHRSHEPFPVPPEHSMATTNTSPCMMMAPSSARLFESRDFDPNQNRQRNYEISRSGNVSYEQPNPPNRPFVGRGSGIGGHRPMIGGGSGNDFGIARRPPLEGSGTGFGCGEYPGNGVGGVLATSFPSYVHGTTTNSHAPLHYAGCRRLSIPDSMAQSSHQPSPRMFEALPLPHQNLSSAFNRPSRASLFDATRPQRMQNYPPLGIPMSSVIAMQRRKSSVVSQRGNIFSGSPRYPKLI